MIIFHNPGCSSSREALSLLENANAGLVVREYLTDPPSRREIKELLKKLGCKAIDIVRKKEPLYIEKYAGKKIRNEEWIKILSANPVLIERPIAISGDRAVVGRPPSLVLDLVAKKS